MTKTVYLHIGQSKTATTALHHFHFRHRKWFEQQGLLYPRKAPGSGPTKKHLGLLRSLMHETEDPTSDEGSWAALRAQVAAAEVDKILVSQEMFWHTAAGEPERRRRVIRSMREGLQPFDAKVIVYLRRQDEWVESWFKQHVKSGKNDADTIEAFVDNRRNEGILDYESRLADWADGFGAENLIVRAYEPSQFVGKDVFADFSALFGIHDISALERPGIRQPTLSNAAVELMLAYKSIKEWGKEFDDDFREMMLGMSRSAPADRSRYLPGAVAGKLLDECAAGNRAVARRYLAGRTELFDKPILDDKARDYPGLSPAEMAHAFARLFVTVHRRLPEATSP